MPLSASTPGREMIDTGMSVRPWENPDSRLGVPLFRATGRHGFGGRFAPPVLAPWGSTGGWGGTPPLSSPLSSRPHSGGRGGGTFGAVECPHCYIICELDTRDPAKCARHRHANLLKPPVCCVCMKKKGWLDFDLHACEQCRIRPAELPRPERIVTIYKDRPKVVEKKVEVVKNVEVEKIVVQKEVVKEEVEKIVVQKEIEIETKIVEKLVPAAEQPLVCGKCSYQTMSPDQFQDHVQNAHVVAAVVETPLLQCQSCAYKTSDVHAFQNHIVHSHSQKVEVAVQQVRELQCKMCEYKTSNADDFQNHVHTHILEVPGPERIIEVPGPERIVERIITKLIKRPEKPAPTLRVPEQVIQNSPKVYRTGGGFLKPEEYKDRYGPKAPLEPNRRDFQQQIPSSAAPAVSNGGVGTVIRRGAGSAQGLTDFVGNSRTSIPAKDFTRPPPTSSTKA